MWGENKYQSEAKGGEFSLTKGGGGVWGYKPSWSWNVKHAWVFPNVYNKANNYYSLTHWLADINVKVFNDIRSSINLILKWKLLDFKPSELSKLTATFQHLLKMVVALLWYFPQIFSQATKWMDLFENRQKSRSFIILKHNLVFNLFVHSPTVLAQWMPTWNSSLRT